MKRWHWLAIGIVASAISGADAQTVSELDTSAVKNTTRARFLAFDSPGRIPGAYLIKFKSPDALALVDEGDRYSVDILPGVMPVSKEEVEGLSSALAALVDGENLDAFADMASDYSGFTVEGTTDEKISRLANDVRIDFIQPIMRWEPSALQSLPSNDDLWALDRIDQRQLPLDHLFQYLSTATTTTVHVVDSGIRRSHVEFGNRPPITVLHCWNQGLSQPACLNFSSQPSNVQDCTGHGSGVASIVGGTTLGVAKQVRLRGYIIMNGSFQTGGQWGCHSGPLSSTQDVVAGLNAAIAAANSDGGPSIINLSVQGAGIDPIVEERVQAALNQNITVVTAAGNSNTNACNFTPGRIPGVITVAASMPNDLRWTPSNYGSCVDLFAPGFNMFGASNQNDSGYSIGSGTSYAAPLVAGIAAVHLEDNESDTPRKWQMQLSVARLWTCCRALAV